MRDEVSMGDQAERLRRMVARAGHTPASRPVRTLSVCSGKGGVGKTTIALNLSLLLGEQGWKVLVIDGDLSLGNAALMAGADASGTASEVIRRTMCMEDALVGITPRVKLLAAGSGDGSPDPHDPTTFSCLRAQIGALEERFDLAVFDTPAGLAAGTTSLLTATGESMVVATPEPTSILDAYAVIKTMTLQKPDHRVSVLINAARRPAEGEEAAEKLRTAVRHFLRRDIQLLGVIPEDPAVGEAIRRQIPVAQLYPRTRAVLSLRALAVRFGRGPLMAPDEVVSTRTVAVL